MPRTSIIETAAALKAKRKKQHPLSAEARILSRLLQQINDPAEAASILTQCTASHKLNLDFSSLKKCNKTTGEREWAEKSAGREMAKLVQRAWDEKTSSKASATPTCRAQRQQQLRRRGRLKYDLEDDDEYYGGIYPVTESVLVAPPKPVDAPHQSASTILDAAAAGSTAAGRLVSSDSEYVVEEDEESIVEQTNGTSAATTQLDQELAILDFWNHLLEQVHLHVVSRTAPDEVGAKKKANKNYQVYRLSGPTMTVSNAAVVEDIRKAVQKEFLSYYDGATTGGRSSSKKLDVRYSECRVYAVLQQQGNNDMDECSSSSAFLWIQINVGRPLDLDDKKGKPVEFLAVVRPESNLVALSVARSRLTPGVLSVLETTLTCRDPSTAMGYYRGVKDVSAQRLGDLSGTNPPELLRSALALEGQHAVGRFAAYAREGKAVDPVTDLHQAATTSQALWEARACRQSQETNQQQAVSTANSRKKEARVSLRMAATAEPESFLLACSRTMGADCRLSAHDSARERQRRKRERDRDFGADGDLPVRKSVRWDWKGQTTAASASVHGPNQPYPKSHEFQCCVELKGSNVLAGMRALMEAGIMKGPLSHYVKDVASLGEGGTVVVDHGAVRTRIKKFKVKASS